MPISDDRSKLYRDMERRKKAIARAEKNNIVAMDGGKARSHSHTSDSSSSSSSNRINAEIRKSEERSIQRSYSTTVLWIVVFVLFLVYVGGYTFSYFKREPVTETKIVLGSVESLIVTDGVIIRDEIVYKSSAAGVAVYSVPEQTRAQKGDILCSIEDGEKVVLLEEQLQNVNTSIMDLQADRQELSVFNEDVKKANQSIKNIINNSAFQMVSGDISAAYTMSDKITNTLEFRNKMLLNESKGNLKSYATRKDFLNEQLENARLNIQVSETGIFSAYIDYQEEYYTFDSMDSISKERTVIKTEPVNLAYEKNVRANSPVFKIVKSNEWYIASYIPTNLILDWTENSWQTVYVESEKTDVFTPLEVRVYKIEKTSAEDTERYVLLKCSKYITEYMNVRGIRFKVEQGIKEGYKLPVNSIVEKTLLHIPKECIFESTKKQSMIIKSIPGQTKGKEVPIVIFNNDSEKDYVTVIQDYTDLQLGDELMVSGKPLETRVISDIENVKGVYVTNSGSAVFCQINMDSEFLSNSEYIVLNPKINTKIKVHDRIVSDIKNIKENQTVY